MKTIKTLAGTRKIDTDAMLIETANGDMIKYKEVVMKELDGDQVFAIMVDDLRGVPVAMQTWREFVNAGANKNEKWNQKAFNDVMSEGYGDY